MRNESKDNDRAIMELYDGSATERTKETTEIPQNDTGADIKVTIAVAKSRTSTNWQNISVHWRKLIQRLSTPQRTPETTQQYAQLSHDDQGKLKDKGGFVGGAVIGGRRTKGSVPLRQVLTLDLDSATLPFEPMKYHITGVWKGEYIVHTTRSYTEKTPRYRCVLLLSRECNSAEYEAVGRYLADRVGINNFDPTTYQTERLMYFPTTSKDGYFNYFHNAGDPFDVDRILGTYTDYTDPNEWAYDLEHDSPDTHKALGTIQEDPLQKGGFVGAFCRAYGITDVMSTLLSQYYTPSEIDGRYTYVGSSGTAGVIVYEDKFVYSHHQTDPNHGKLLNAFDLVRLTLFGSLDNGVHGNTKTENLPSWGAMVKHFANDKKVLEQSVTPEQLALFEVIESESGTSENATGNTDTDNVEDSSDKKAPVWYTDLCSQLERSLKTGEPLANRNNYSTILANDPHLLSNVTNDTFRGQLLITGDNIRWERNGLDPYWGDADDASARVYIETLYDLPPKGLYDDCFLYVMQSNSRRIDSGIDFITRADHWDGIKRAETLFIDLLGVEDTPLNRKVTLLWLKAIVARQFTPGVKFDNMILFSGEENIGKSTILNLLAGEYFTDSLRLDMNIKEQMELMQGNIIVELSELAGMDKQTNESMKALLSRREDSYRPAYGKRVVRHKRRCVFAGTTNEIEVLRSLTGNRRMWVMLCRKEFQIAKPWEILTPDTVSQVWAEVRELYKTDKSLVLTQEETQEMTHQQEYFSMQDPLETKIIEFLLTPVPESYESKTPSEKRDYFRKLESGNDLLPFANVRRNSISAVEILVECLGEEINDRSRYKTRGINNILRNLTGVYDYGTARKDGYGRQRNYIISDEFFDYYKE